MASLSEGIASFPRGMRLDLESAAGTRSERTAIDALLTRDDMTPGVALMAGLCSTVDGRSALDTTLKRYAATDRDLPASYGEIVIGAGAHAAVYASARVASGYAPPLVLSDSPRFGGEFASTVRPSFFLNSRNRPGPIGQPGSRDALNVIPGAPMQPADIGGTEYQTDADMGIVVRCALALNAEIRFAPVREIDRQGDAVLVLTDRGVIVASRVIVATGVGRERTVGSVQPDGRNLYSFRQWMARIGEERFPLRDLGRVAVIGAGDGARTVVESLAGIGPNVGLSMTALDYVPRIDWYGIEQCAVDRTGWVASNRTRYQRLGALFPVNGRENARVTPYGRAVTVAPAFQGVTVNGRQYETVITAAGYDDPRDTIGYGAFDTTFRAIDATLTEPERFGRGVIARKSIAEVYRIGPSARIEFGDDEDSRIGENAVGLFRLAPRTASLAAVLPPVVAP